MDSAAKHGGDSLIGSLKIQTRVLGALIMRETQTRYGRHNIGFIWLFAEPMLLVFGITAVWIAMGRGRDNVPVAPFIVTGYCPLLLWRYCCSRAMNCLSTNASLLYHRNVRALDIFLSRTIIECCGAFVAFALISALLALMGLLSVSGNLLMLYAGWGLLAWFSFGFGLILCCLSERSEFVERIWGPLSYLVYPISGVFFMVEWLPSSLRETALWFPLTDCIEMIRSAILGPSYQFYYHPVYVIFINACLTYIGLLMLREVRHNLEPG